jgi:hypothetical protein
VDKGRPFWKSGPTRSAMTEVGPPSVAVVAKGPVAYAHSFPVRLSRKTWDLRRNYCGTQAVTPSDAT